MAIDKSNTPVWMKVVLIVLAVVLMFGFVTIGASPFLGGGNQQTVAPAGSLEAATQRFAPTVSGLTGMLQSDPESYTVLVSLGNTYFDWALEAQKVAQTTSANAGADLPLWISAKDAYGRAVAVKAGEPPVTVDYAITLFYTGDTLRAIEQAESITKSTPDFALAWFNLGIFYGAIGENEKAVEGFERYLKLDSQDQFGNTDFAKKQIESLKSSSTTPTP